ncbi:MAG: XdhC family protein [Clostridia bacterium]|nr:XdhC family protein [Clostridia bacterium]
MRKEFQDILESVRAGREATLTRTVDGRVYTRRFLPPERLVLLGGGHVSLALYEAAVKVGFAVTVVDDRPAFSSYARFPEAKEVICDSFEDALPRLHIGAGDFVCVLTRGHKDDVTCMKYLLRGNEPRYLGMIGSHRRVKGLFELLVEEGFDQARLARVHAPIGLSIGAVTPAEIAVSILAELIAARHALPTGDELLPQQNTDLEALSFLSDDSRPAALLLVLSTKGSTPVKGGALMAADKLGNCAGTIGGGCGENQAILAARRLIGTGKSQVVTVDMTNDVAAMEGMVCGGTMDVLIEDLPVQGV